MLKKYLSLLLAVCMLFSCFAVVNAEEVTTEEVAEEIVDVVVEDESHAALVEKMQALGLITDEFDLSDPQSTITRINFVKMLIPFLGYEELVSESIEGDIFADISKDYSGAGYVKASKDLGCLTGYEDNYFYPEAPVEFNEVVKSLVVGLGYNVKAQFYGEYPTGVLAAAREIGLLKGIDVTTKATNKNLLQLFDNALTIPVYDVVSTGENTYYQEGKEMLSDRHDLYIIKAPVNATSITSLGTTALAPQGKVNVGGIILEADSTLGVDGYLGYKVDAYYHKVKGDAFGTLLYYTASDDNFVLEVTSENIRPNSSEFSAYKFVFYDEAIEETDTMDIATNATVIINGKSKAMYTAADLAPAYGDVKLIDNNDDGVADCVIVFKATDIVIVNSISTMGREVSIINNLANGAYTLYEADTTTHYIIYEDGKVVTLSDVYEGATLVIGRSEDNSYDVVKMSKVTVPGTIDSTDEQSVSINGEYFEVGDNYVTLAKRGTSAYAVMKPARDGEGNIIYDANGDMVLTMIDITGTFYIDYQGKIQGVKETTDDSLIYGFILAADDPTDALANKNRRLSDSWKFRILGEDGAIRTLTIPEKINIDGTMRTADFAINLINNPTQTDGIYKNTGVPYYRNNDGVKTGEVVPNDFRTNGGQFSERQICKFKFDTETNEVKELWFQGSDELSYDGEWIYYADNDSTYQFYQSTWQRKFYAQSTVVFLIREKEDQCEVTTDYRTEGNTVRSNKQPIPSDTTKTTANAIYFYNVDESLNVDCGVQFISSATAQYGNDVSTKTPYIVKGKVQGVNSDGIPVTGLKLIDNSGTEKSIYVSAETKPGVVAMIEIAKPGDILVYSLDAYGAISSIRYLFKADGNLTNYRIMNIGTTVGVCASKIENGVIVPNYSGSGATPEGGSCINASIGYHTESGTLLFEKVNTSKVMGLSLLPSSGGQSLMYGVIERFPSGTNLVFSFPGNANANYLLRERVGTAKVAMIDLTNPAQPSIKTGLLPTAINVGDSVLMHIHNTYQQAGGEPLNIWIIKK
ncbi:MAG: S-layer homology domain-containing protein [Clostridia bacterium]|nr:S-layer homology domain-containing protein [Clostridia bacterium]